MHVAATITMLMTSQSLESTLALSCMFGCLRLQRSFSDTKKKIGEEHASKAYVGSSSTANIIAESATKIVEIRLKNSHMSMSGSSSAPPTGTFSDGEGTVTEAQSEISVQFSQFTLTRSRERMAHHGSD